MDAPPSSVSYLRVVQNLQKKTDELERVFAEARRLEQEKSAVSDEKAALVQRVAELEAESRARRAEFSELEAQVVRQQQHLQKYIEKEVAEARERAARPRGAKPMPDAKPVAHSGATHEAERAALRRENASLRAELRAAKSASGDDAAMGAIEARALAGVKSELTAFAAENASLLDALEEERRKGRAFAADAAAAQDLLRRQRDASARQLAIAQAELRALGAQSDAMLEDLRRAHAAGAGRRGIDRGTLTTAAPAERSGHSLGQGQGHSLGQGQGQDAAYRAERQLVVAQAELRAVLEALVGARRALSDAVARSRRQMRSARTLHDAGGSDAASAGDRSAHGDPLLDAVFAHIAGIRQAAEAVQDLGDAHVEAMRRQKQDYEQRIQEQEHKQQKMSMLAETDRTRQHRNPPPLTRSPDEPLLTTTSVDGHISEAWQTRQPLPAATAVQNIGTWLAAREQNLQCQIRDSTCIVSQPLQYNIKSVYQSGETLAEAANQVRGHSTRFTRPQTAR